LTAGAKGWSSYDLGPVRMTRPSRQAGQAFSTADGAAPDKSLHAKADASQVDRNVRAAYIRDGWWFLLVFLAALAVLVSTDTGRMIFETKLGVDINAQSFLARLWSLWNPLESFGTLQDQYIGYAIPMAPFFLVGQLLHVPIWLIERLWLSALITTGFAGIVRLAAALRIGTPGTRMLGAAMFVLWPTFTIVIGSTSAAALPGLIAPWSVLPLVSAARGAMSYGRAAAWSGLAIAAMGGVNAVYTLAVLVLPAVYVLSCSQARHRIEFFVKWAVAVIAACSWWAIPLILQGKYSFNFLPFIEQTVTTSRTMSASAVIRGAGFWTAYFNVGGPWITAGWTDVTAPLTILASGVAASTGLFGLARRDMPERRWLLICVGLVSAVMLAGYYGPGGGPLHSGVNVLFNGPLAPFRSLYKFEPVLALALALGCAHALAILWQHHLTLGKSRRLTVGAATAPVTALILAGLAVPAISGQILQPGSFAQVPKYWYQVARYLAVHSDRSTALLLPAAGHGQYIWGEPIDDPMEPLASSPWAQRSLVPFGGAGSQVLLSTVEQAVESGQAVPGLATYLARAGIRYLVIRNDLSPSMTGYVPPQVVNETITQSGFQRVASFGPRVAVASSYPRLSGFIAGDATSYPATEIYQATNPADRLGPVAALPLNRTVLVNGGPDSLLQLAAEGVLGTQQPVIIAGDHLPARPALWAVTDGQRRADNAFGDTDSNISFTYTATEKNPPDDPLGGAGGPPRQILPVPAAGHQTIAVLTGAAQVTASSWGSWLEESPQDDPANAFDGNPHTAWVEGDPKSPDGQWIEVRFTKPIHLGRRVGIHLLDDSPGRAIANQLVVTTARGKAITNTIPTPDKQPLNTPVGATQWLRITISSASGVVPSGPGAGISDVTIPGVQVTRYLKPAEDRAGMQVQAVVYSFEQSASGSYSTTGQAGPLPLSRVFTTSRHQSLRLRATALPNPGPALDALISRIDARGRALQISASSSWDSIPQLGPENLISPITSPPWIAGAGDINPTLKLRWPGRRRINTIIVTPAEGQAAAPTVVEINSPAGRRLATIGVGGTVRIFPPLWTDQISLSFPGPPVVVGNTAAGQPTTLPVGLARISIPALRNLTPPLARPSTTFTLRCGQGPRIYVDGHSYATSVTGAAAALVQMLPVNVRLCNPTGDVGLAAGTHWLQAGPSAEFAVTNLSLLGVPAHEQHAAAGSGSSSSSTSGPRRLRIDSWQPDHRTVVIGPGQSSYLEIHENFNQGWIAIFNRHRLPAVILDGWQQAFIVPAGQGGLITLSYTPASLYHLGLLASALALLSLVATALGLGLARRFGREADAGDHRPAAAKHLRQVVQRRRHATATANYWSRTVRQRWRELPGPARSWASLIAPMIVIFLTGGPLTVIVPVLYLVSRWQPLWLPRIALIAMLVATYVSVVTLNPIALGSGSFSILAQVMALVALAATLTATTAADATFHDPPRPNQRGRGS
jgi:arabinofuranan 3-O-arabinosyltransferase